MRLSDDEQDSLAANCGHCWARPGTMCRTPKGRPVRPHKARKARARRRGLTGGAGRLYLARSVL